MVVLKIKVSDKQEGSERLHRNWTPHKSTYLGGSTTICQEEELKKMHPFSPISVLQNLTTTHSFTPSKSTMHMYIPRYMKEDWTILTTNYCAKSSNATPTDSSFFWFDPMLPSASPTFAHEEEANPDWKKERQILNSRPKQVLQQWPLLRE